MNFGFYNHLSETFPSQIMIDVTEYCNLKCIHCPHPVFSESDLWTGAQLKVETHKKLIDEIKRDGLDHCNYIRYTSNGEPLIHKKFIEMVQYTHKTIPTVPINVTTNGRLLNEKRTLALLDAGVNVFDVSLDAFYNETYAKIRVKGDLNVTRENVLRLINLIKTHKYNTKLVVSYVEQDLNKNETHLFEKYWKEQGADFVVIRPQHSAAGAVEKNAEEIKKKQFSKSVERKPCLYPWERLILSPTGHIGYCPADWKYGSKFVKFSDEFCYTIDESKYMKDLRKAHLANNFSCHKFCGDCPDWEFTTWPNEGRSYSNVMNDLVDKDEIIRKENVSVPSDLIQN